MSLFRLLALLISAGLLTGGCQSEPAQSAEPATATQDTVQQEVFLPPDSATAARFGDAMAYAKTHALHERSLGEIMQVLGTRFLGTPYVSFPLDQTNREQLVCRLDGFDCFTFVEAILAMARTVKAQDYTWATYVANTREQRYRSGEPMGYCSRLHYFSDWIAENERRSLVRNLTQELGGVRLDKTLDFMSTHRTSYPRFAQNDSLYRCIQEMEAQLADLSIYHLPEDRIQVIYDRLRPGDIVAFSTRVKGLDVAHTGLVYKAEDGSTGLLHASSASGRVKVSPDLQAYVQSIDTQIGIVVTRPVSSSN